MKTCYLSLLLSFAICYDIHSEIRNGYSNRVSVARQSLFELTRLLREKKLDHAQRVKQKENIELARRIITYHELTDLILGQFNSIAPDLYAEVNNITDSRGRPVDVYIKIVPPESGGYNFCGVTALDQSKLDNDACSSEYGEQTVSVDVYASSTTLRVLAHELGHVVYLIPNLRTYFDFYRSHYPREVINSFQNQSRLIGHLPKDPCGESSLRFEKRFRKSALAHFKKKDRKIESPMTLLAAITREIKTNLSGKNAAQPLDM